MRDPHIEPDISKLCNIAIPYEASSSLATQQPHDLLNEIDVIPHPRRTETETRLGDCSICLCPLVKNVVDDKPTGSGVRSIWGKITSLRKRARSSNDEDVLRLNCQHCFHRHCLKHAMEKHKPVCPVCRKPLREPQGSCPSGIMTIQVLGDHPCPGFYNDDASPVASIQIDYSIPSGIQAPYHYHPQSPFQGTYRVAYLPNNREGRNLLSRLVYAWKHGLIFTIGTSLTTHIPNSVVWTSIHQKTSLHGGPFGFPDAGYLLNCNESLDALYVPDAESCLATLANVT